MIRVGRLGLRPDLLGGSGLSPNLLKGPVAAIVPVGRELSLPLAVTKGAVGLHAAMLSNIGIATAS